MKRHYIFVFLLIVPLLVTGFTLDNAIVPKEEILAGGPPKDGIPALLNRNLSMPRKPIFWVLKTR